MDLNDSQAFPLQIGSSELFARVRNCLAEARYSEAEIFKTLKIDKMNLIGGIDLSSIDFSNVAKQFKTLLELFCGSRCIDPAAVESALQQDVVDAFRSLGLIGELSDSRLYGRVLLYPVSGFYVASDRHSNPDGTPFQAPVDIVFPAIFGGTLRFLRLLPQNEVNDALDLCAGSGIGAFVLSRHSKRVVSSDVTERATHFARFNAKLNSLENVEAICGDLYGGVRDRQFDLIVAHPPYVPSIDNATIWRDGGITGELIARRIIEGLPKYLRPGGTACVVSLGVDTHEGSFEQRARQWLADSRDQFDIIFATTDERSPAEILHDMTLRDPELGSDKIRRLGEAFAESGILKMPHGALVLKRSTEPAHVGWSLRTNLSEVTDGNDFEHTFQLHPLMNSQAALSQLADMSPKFAERLQVIATHVVHEGSLVPAEFIFETDKPFDVKGRVDSWMIPLMTRLDGSVTLRDVYVNASSEGDLPEGFQLEDFVQLVARMIERGFFELPKS